LDGTRVYFNHYYLLKEKKDSIQDYSLAVGHEFNSENKFYEYRQAAATDLFVVPIMKSIQIKYTQRIKIND